jgi:hypothetical protein
MPALVHFQAPKAFLESNFPAMVPIQLNFTRFNCFLTSEGGSAK